MIHVPGLRCNRRFTTILNKKGQTLVALMTRILTNRRFSHSCFSRKQPDHWTSTDRNKMSTDGNKTNEAADWIHDSTNFSNLRFAVHWLPKSTYGCCRCRIGFLHLRAARKHGNARCKSYSNALPWTKKREELFGALKHQRGFALLLEAAFSPSFFISTHLWQRYTAEQMKGEIQWIYYV